MKTLLISIIPIVFLILIVFIISKVLKNASQKLNLISGKTLKTILVIYMAILCMGTVIYYMLPNKGIGEVTNAKLNFNKAQKAIENFDIAVHQGMLPESEGVYVKKEWGFSYDKDRLLLTTTKNDNNIGIVLVERKNGMSNDHKINVVQYSTVHMIDDFDYSHLIQPFKLELNDTLLTISKPKPFNLEFAKFHKDFTITQFTGEKMFLGTNYIEGRNVLYFHVPESVEVVGGEGVYVQFVE